MFLSENNWALSSDHTLEFRHTYGAAIGDMLTRCQSWNFYLGMLAIQESNIREKPDANELRNHRCNLYMVARGHPGLTDNVRLRWKIKGRITDRTGKTVGQLE